MKHSKLDYGSKENDEKEFEFSLQFLINVEIVDIGCKKNIDIVGKKWQNKPRLNSISVLLLIFGGGGPCFVSPLFLLK